MAFNRLGLILAFLLLLFFVSTSSGLANLSAVQEQLRAAQLKLIKEKIKLLQEQVLKVGQPKEKPVKPAEEPVQNREELARRLETQIKALEQVVASLKPKAVEEETARIEKRIAEINIEIKTASGEKLLVLQEELQKLLIDYSKLQESIQRSLEEQIKERQIILLREQIRIAQEKLKSTPAPEAKPDVPVKKAPTEDQSKFKTLQEEIEKVRLRLIQAQAKAVQEKINQLKK